SSALPVPGAARDRRRSARCAHRRHTCLRGANPRAGGSRMFEALSDRLSGVLTRLTGKGALTEEDVTTALREVRVALLEADVSLPVARDFIRGVQEKATGSAVLKSVTPGQMVVKIVHDELIRVLAGDDPEPGRLKI